MTRKKNAIALPEAAPEQPTCASCPGYHAILSECRMLPPQRLGTSTVFPTPKPHEWCMQHPAMKWVARP